jgi:kojibiose phosphorylase
MIPEATSTSVQSAVRAVLFDLDGVITDTAEYHFQAWKLLADELGIPFSRVDNEDLRGVSRRESLDLLLDGHSASEEDKQIWMDRKNESYGRMLENLAPGDLLPGVRELFTELRAAGVKIAIASASKNSPEVVERLGIRDQIDALVHGGQVSRAKPAPDLFLQAARTLGIHPAHCLVIEDAQAGIEAAHAAGMTAIGLGPIDRVGDAELALPSLEGVSLDDLKSACLWRVSETEFSADAQHHRETIFTIGNGYLATRGSLEERHPGDRQATFIHGIYDDRPVVFTELANAPDWAALEIWVDGQRFSIDSGTVRDYVRWLDLRTGTLHRRLNWRNPQGKWVEIRFSRFASLDDEHALVQRLSVTPVNDPAEIRVRASLNSHVENHQMLHWNLVAQESTPDQAGLAVRTRSTQKTVVMAASLSSPGGKIAASDCSGQPGLEAVVHVPAGETAGFEKFTAVYTDRDTGQVSAAAANKCAQLRNRGYEDLFEDNWRAWQGFWDPSDVIIEGDEEAQLALRHALFQLRIAAPTRDEHVSIGAKTLSGFAYAGHVFWDNEIFVLPFFTFTQPSIARNMLMYRYHTLPEARKKAAQNGYTGAQYAWESAETGEEVTPTWVPDPKDRTKLIRIWTGDIQLHITADVAYAMHQYWQATGDDEFWKTAGIPVVLETAVFWGDRAEPEGDRFSLRNVIGCDEYHDHVDNNAFTNAIAAWHLRTAIDSLAWLAEVAPAAARELTSRLDLSPDRLAHWRRVAAGLLVRHDPESGLIEQFEGFFDLKDVDWPAYEGRKESMQSLLGIEGANEHKVLKQADVIALFALLGENFDRKTWQANWDYYIPITDHTYGSSLGPAMHAWVGARMGLVEEAYEHFLRAARADLADVRGNAGDGIHAASAGGLWEAAVFGFAGLRLTPSGLVLDPRLPSHWKRLAFKIQHQGKTETFDIRLEGGENIG